MANYDHEGISVIEADRLPYGAHYEVFICDESDELWKHHSAVFVPVGSALKYRLCGMGAVYNSIKAVMVSATSDKLEDELLARLFGTQACDQLHFQNLETVAKGERVQAYERTSHEAKTPEELKLKIEAYLKSNVTKKPLILFDTSPNDGFNVDCEAICEAAGVPYASIQTDKDAIEGRKLYAEEKRGCYELALKFARSLDWKLAVNPTVLIRNPGKDLAARVANQMCGRSPRNRGKGEAVLFGTGNGTLSKDLWDRLAASEQALPLGCGKNLLRLIQLWDEFSDPQMSVARSGFHHNKWQCSENDFSFICSPADVMMRAITQKQAKRDQEAQLKPFLKKSLQ